MLPGKQLTEELETKTETDLQITLLKAITYQGAPWNISPPRSNTIEDCRKGILTLTIFTRKHG